MALVMVAIQTIAVFIVYAVFSTLVAEKRHDIGVLLGLGARRRDIAGAFLLAGLAACVLGGASGWLLGWGVLAGLNPLSKALNMPLFPQDVIYTPEAPTSFDPLIPLFFMGVMSVVGVIAVALPAWRAARIVPVDILRESA
jgi:ABC-type lipoprotein release transport system permease subunit